jgi:hypothetical protein
MIRRIALLFMLPIFLYSSPLEVISLAKSSKLYENNEWKALLHFGGNLKINDPKFILSYDTFSLEKELELTIEALFEPAAKYTNSNLHPQCRFPARFLFLKQELNVSEELFPNITCSDFITYTKKAPADSISLIYASENVTNPSSMMGHTFLKIKGVNDQNREVAHAITFYTVIESMNLLTLAYQNTFSGMQGLYGLRPYQETLEPYIKNENRNIWDYELKLDDYKRKLIHYHMWELKDAHMKYFFTNYNCSTVIYYILSLAEPSIYENKSFWITPLETVKLLYKNDLIVNSTMTPSDEWLVKMTAEHKTGDEIKQLLEIMVQNNSDKIASLDFESLMLLDIYAQLQLKNDDLHIDTFTELKKNIQKNSLQENTVDLSQYKSPSKIPDERQFALGYASVDNTNYAQISFLPASHFLNDDNREYFGESELKIFNMSFLANANELKIKEFTLYGMKSYIPYSLLTKDISYEFELGMQRDYEENDMTQHSVYKIEGGMGIDFQIATDIHLFSMLNGGIGYSKKNDIQLRFSPKLGLMMYEIFDMKSLFVYQPLFLNENKIYDKYIVEHNIFLTKNWKLYINAEHIKAKESFSNYGFGLSRYF